MPNTLNDGNIPFGSQVVSVGSGSYVAEEIEFEQKATSIIRRDEQNIPNGAVHIRDLVKGKMTLQLESATSAIPEILSTASLTFLGATKTFAVTSVSQPQKQDEIHKIKVEFTELLNS